MKKGFKLLILTLCVALGLSALAACGGDSDKGAIPDGKVRVQFMDNTKELSHTDIDKGGKVARPETNPTKAGYDFVDWYATPSCTIVFDFDEEIEENTKVYAGFRSQAEDKRDWYLSGSFQAEDISEAGAGYWDVYSEAEDGTTIPTPVKFTRDATQKNKYTLTVNLYKGDEFKIAWEKEDTSLTHNIGPESIVADKYTTDDTKPFYCPPAGVFGANIKVGVSAQYKITLITDVGATEKEGLTRWDYEKVGEAPQLAVQYNYFVKGANVTNWNNAFYNYVKFDTKDKTVYTLTIGLVENEKFMILGTEMNDDKNTVKLNLNKGGITLADDDKTKAAVAFGTESWDNDIHVIGGTGTYALTLTEGDNGPTLKAEKTADTMPAYDYYVKGSIGGDTSWEERHPMTLNSETGMYEFTTEIAKDEEFTISVVKHGEDANSELLSINTSYVDVKTLPNELDVSKNNFKITQADTYTIAINPVNMGVSVKGEKSSVTYCVAFKGSASNWVVSSEEGEVFEVNTGDPTKLTQSITLECGEGDEIMFVSYNKGDAGKQQVGYCHMKSSVSEYAVKLCDGFDTTSQGNIKCTADGTYTFELTINSVGQFTALTVTAAAAA